MTYRIDLSEEKQRLIEAAAAAAGVDVEAFIVRGAETLAQSTTQTSPEIAARLAAIEALPTCNTRAGLPELDLSGSRADVYGYTERENAQL